jgi:hypothetical protein
MFNRDGEWLNFPLIVSQVEAEFLTPPPLMQSREDRWHHEWAQLRPNIPEADERRLAEWRCLHPEDVEWEQAFWTQKKDERRAAMREKMRWNGLSKPSSVARRRSARTTTGVRIFLTSKESSEGSIHNDE